jgi:flagellar basal-body rod protein FlgG
MIDALYIAASGLRSEQKQIDVISNNVANMQTPGFKRGRVDFAEVATSPGTVAGADLVGTSGGGARASSTITQFAPGEIRATHNPLDLAVDGEGFFELQSADGELMYTRDGQFRLDAEGYLVSSRGLPLSRQIQVPAGASDIHIAADGTVSALLPGDTERSDLGAIELVTFGAPDMLVGRGDNLFAAVDEAGAPTYGRAGDPGFGQLRQGFIEMSNVEMIDEMSALVIAQRAYQLNARLLQASDQVLETINNLRR